VVRGALGSRQAPRHAAQHTAAHRTWGDGSEHAAGRAQPKTMRLMLEEHRKNPTCNMWPRRDRTARGCRSSASSPSPGSGGDVDWQANGAHRFRRLTMPDGKEIEGPADLRRALLSRPRPVRPGADSEAHDVRAGPGDRAL